MIYIGIDSGLSGVVAILDCGDEIRIPPGFAPYLIKPEYYHMPIKEVDGQRTIDWLVLGEFLQPYLTENSVIAFERLWGFGAASKGKQKGQFAFARNYSRVECAIEQSGIPTYMLPAQKWQTLNQKPKHPKGLTDEERYERNKAWSIATAQENFPLANLIPDGCWTPDDGRADATNIARAGALIHYRNEKLLAIPKRRKRA